MPSDFLYYWLVQPLGIAALIAVVASSFAVWRVVLGPEHHRYGFKPLVVAYSSALCGHTLLNFYFSHQEFNNRVARSVLQEPQRWSIVPGWTLYVGVLTLLLLLPLLLLLSAFAAALLRSRKLSYRTIALTNLSLAVFISVAMWWFSSGTWLLKDHLELLASTLVSATIVIALTVLPFLGIIGYLANARSKPAT